MARFALAPSIMLVAGGLLLAGCAGGGPSDEVVAAKVGVSLLEAATDSAQRRDHVTAVTYYRSLYERNPNDHNVVLGLSRSLRQLMRPKEAQGVVRRALQSAPKDAALLTEMGKIQLALGEAMDAIENLTTAETQKPAAWDLQVALGIAYDRVGLYEQAERRYRRALDLAPENVVALNNYGLSLAQANRLDEAIGVLERASHLPEATIQVRQNLAMLHAMRGDLAAAERLMRGDLSPDVVAHNLGYYRRLQAGGEQLSLQPIMPVGGDEAAPLPRAATAPRSVAAAPSAPARSLGVAPLGEPLPPVAESAAASEPDGKTAAMQPIEGASAPVPVKPRRDLLAAKCEKPPAKMEAAAAPLDLAAIAPASGGDVRLQLGSFPEQKAAERGIEVLRKRFDDVIGWMQLSVARVTVEGRGEMFRIVSERLPNKSAAQVVCQRLVERSAGCLVMRGANAEKAGS